MRRTTIVLLWFLIATSLGAQQIYWKRDHIYRGPGGKAIAIVTPLPSDQSAPTAPTGLSNAPPTSTTVELSWSPSTDSGGSGLAGYKIYRGNVPVGTAPPGWGGTVYFTDKPLRPNTSYTYSVRGFDNAQNHSAPSNTITITASP